MKILQIGLGSMGKRRIRCLKENGVKEIIAFDVNEKRREEVREKYRVAVFGSFGEAISSNPDAVIISVPGYLHMEYIKKAVMNGKHVFVEVPFSLTNEGIDEIKKMTADKKLVVAPGCQLLFHPPTITLKEWVKSEEFGKLLHVSYSMGTYLPDWHPYESITSFYASDMSKGGGNLDVIAQELVWLSWIVGSKIKNVTSRIGKIGDLLLANNTPDHIELIVEYENDLMMNLHFDVNDRTHESYIRFAGENETAVWSKSAFNELKLYNAKKGEWVKYKQPKDYNFELTYINEIGYWIECIKGNKQWPVSLELAEDIVLTLEGIKLSSDYGRTVSLEEIK